MAFNTTLDFEQVIKRVYNEAEEALQITGASSGTPIAVSEVGGRLVTEPFDYVALTNSTIGGEVVPTTVTYKTGGAGGATVATLTLTYDGSANLLTVTKS